MDLRQLRYLAALGGTRSLSQAAATLGVSPGTLVRNLQRMEREVGMPVFERAGDELQPTSAGARLMEQAGDILALSERAVQQMHALGPRPPAPVVVGMPPMIAESLVVPLVRRFGELHPGLSLRVRECPTLKLLEWIASDQVDLAVVYNAPPRPRLWLETLAADDLLLVGAPASAPMQSTGAIALHEALALHLLMPKGGNGLHDLLEAAARQRGLAPDISFHIDGIAPILSLVREGMGFTCLPYSAVASRLASGELRARPIADPVLPGVLSLAASARHAATPAMQQVFACIREVVALHLQGPVMRSGAHRQTA